MLSPQLLLPLPLLSQVPCKVADKKSILMASGSGAGFVGARLRLQLARFKVAIYGADQQRNCIAAAPRGVWGGRVAL